MTHGAWDPAQYLRYEGQRLRPALDLLARVDVAAPLRIHDVGCGTGQMAKIMADRWPDAHVVGSDESEEMLAEARRLTSNVEWRRLDVTTWDEEPINDVIFSNAVLHWIPDHDELLLRMLASVRPGGALAVQMPLSWYEPSHELMRTVLEEGRLGSPELRQSYGTPNVAEPSHYAELLLRHTAIVDLWTTRYYQALRGPDPVLEWVSGTALRPVLDELPPAELAVFLERYAARLRAAYPTRSDGSTLFPFHRLLFVASM